MYESYPWPGAYTLKDEMRLFVNWFKKVLEGLHKNIEKIENKK